MSKLPVLLAAAFVQLNGAQFKRRYELAMKILIIVAPGVGSTLDRQFGGEDTGEPENDRFANLWTIVTGSQGLLEKLTDLVIALLGWFVFLTAAIWLIIGHLVNAATRFLAQVLREGMSFDISTVPGNVLKGLKAVGEQLRDAWEVQYDYTIEPRSDDSPGSFNSNEPYDAGVPKPAVGSIPTFFIPTFAFSDQAGGYRDGGPRQDYQLQDGRLYSRTVSRGGEEGTWQPFASENRDYSRTRAFELVLDPRFDMLAASNDRVFVKRKGEAEFWFGIPAEMFAGTENGDQGPPVPSTYFKLDPEPKEDPKGRTREISTSSYQLLNYSKSHPQAERLPLFHAAISAGALPAMIVSVKPRVLYKLDTRPPRVGVGMPNQLTRGSLGLKTRPAIRYKRTPGDDVVAVPEFAFGTVLGMAVGNFHFYEPWIADYGGEIQWIASKGLFGLGYNSAIYGLFNGPIDDGDGAIDGTCNFYILVKMQRKNDRDRFGILWCDEQTFFTKRWRLLHPADNKPVNFDPPDDVNLSVHALVEADNQESLIGGQYSFNRQKFLDSDPGEQGWLNENSRLAGARQALVVNGRQDGKVWLFSITYSYGCVDYCWRRREPPPGTADFDRMRMREDLTIMIAGSAGTGQTGHWVQRYLPANRQFPDGDVFRHPWRFLPEAAAQRLDRYPYFGVLAEVDQRVQYYRVELLEINGLRINAAAAAVLDGVKLCDLEQLLYIRARKFKWGRFNELGVTEKFLKDTLPGEIDKGKEIEALTEFFFASYKDPPKPEEEYRQSRTSMFNDHARFRLHDRGPLGWILLWDDKRDDDLISLADLPRTVVLHICPPDPADPSDPGGADFDGGGRDFDNPLDMGLVPLSIATPLATPDAATLATTPLAAAAALSRAADLAAGLAGFVVRGPPRTVTVRILAQERLQLPPPVSVVTLSKDNLPDGSVRLRISLEVPLSLVESLRHIWTMHIALWPATQNTRNGPRRVTVPEGVRLDRFTPKKPLELRRTVFELALKGVDAADLDLLETSQADNAAAAIWFEGPSGLVSTPDKFVWL